MATYAIIAAVSYLLGSIPFGYILVRLFLKQDIRATGSGNIGATNVGRTGHKELAIATLVLDAGKGFLAVWLVTHITTHFVGDIWLSDVFVYHGPPGSLERCVAALFAICGHLFPVWLRFRGGKGVATGAGAFIALAPKALLVVLMLFVAVVLLFRYVSLGSIIATAGFPVAVYFLTDYKSPLVIALVAVCALLIIAKHHQNIGRLLSGTENRLGAKKAQERPA